MLDVGDDAPAFSLPGCHREDIDTFALEEYDGRIVVLVFYPMDFSPVCEKELQALRQMELFSISEAVDLLAVSADSAYAHRAFAREFDIDFPLLSDRTGEVASRYGVIAEEIDGHENVPHRAVFVIDTRRTIRHAWMTEDPSVVPDTDAIREAVESISDDDVAAERFEEGRSKFRYGRSEVDNGRDALADDRLELAVETLDEAVWYFGEAVTAFERANRYADDRGLAEAAEIAEQKAKRFRQAAEWFCEAAQRSAAGEDAIAEDVRSDAEDALDQARQYAPLEELYSG